MNRVAPRQVPEQGQIALLRQGRFVVTDVRPSQLPQDSQLLQHLVTAASIEEDALGEEIQVVWEIEVGAQVFERVALPSPLAGFDDPRRLNAFLDAVRWGAASQADVRMLQSPFRSGVELNDYQLEPLVRALQMPRVNLLIADDVGLGKTIEAGLVCQELLLRHRARKVLIVCPSALQIQWRDQMWEKFGLEFHIVDATLQKELRRSRGLAVNPWAHFPRLITSIDFLKRERPLRLFRETLPPDGQPTYPPSGICSSWTRRTTWPHRVQVATPSTPSALVPCASWCPMSSTNCSSPPPRITATPKASPPCSNSSTASALPVASSQIGRNSARSWCVA